MINDDGIKQKPDRFYMDQNKDLWNLKTPVHIKSDFYDHAAFKSGSSSLTSIDLAYLPDVKEKKLIHLQCHFGQDTMSLERNGAQCVGIDYSSVAIEEAKKTAAELNLNSRFYESNVYDVLDLNLGKFDIVFTSIGVLGWLPELDSWARVVAELLEDGGSFYITEFHPVLYMFEFESQQLMYPYFNSGHVFSENESFTYADREYPLEAVSHFWQHSLDEVLEALISHNVEILRFKEFDYSPFNCFPHMRQIGERKWQYGDQSLHLPHLFHILGRKKK